MKRLFALLLLLSTTLLTGCDIPDVEFYERSYEVPATGGEMVIPVNSTGLDEVGIKYYGSNNKDWGEVVEVMDHAHWQNGIRVSKSNSRPTTPASVARCESLQQVLEPRIELLSDSLRYNHQPCIK